MAGPGAGSGGAEVPNPAQEGAKEGSIQKPTNDADALKAVRDRLGVKPTNDADTLSGAPEPGQSEFLGAVRQTFARPEAVARQIKEGLTEKSTNNADDLGSQQPRGEGFLEKGTDDATELNSPRPVELQGRQPQVGETFGPQGVLGAVTMMGPQGERHAASLDNFVQQGEAAQRTYDRLVGDQEGEGREPSDRETRIAEQQEKGRAFWEGLPEGARNWLLDKMIADGVNPVGEGEAQNTSFADQLRQILSRPEAVYKRLQELAAVQATPAQEAEAQRILEWMFSKTTGANPPEGDNPESAWYGDTKFRKIPPEATQRFVKAAAEFAKLLNEGPAETSVPTLTPTETPTPAPTSEIRPTTAETPQPIPPAGTSGK